MKRAAIQCLVTTGLVIIASYAFAGQTPTTIPTPMPTPAPIPTGTPLPLLAESDKKKLISEFQKALTDEKNAFAHQEKSAMRELSAAQGMKQKTWREEQKKARREYFDQHMSGPERRDYVQQYLKKKMEFDATLKAELVTAKKDWMEKLLVLRKKQKEKEEKFNSSVAQGVRPPDALWH